ncbi:hypothetical protein [Streptomyces sp. NBRC 110028]|uniref:hypothetical protein n=1 Tax=Streptomyces sp. NBRC 110028 TaxID=1621260 RepID=UPI000AA1CB63|nr:hypothetical protein [Streptomyces sp. NBRC 110028]
MVFIAVLLPPGLMCLALAMGRYEEWLLKQPAPVRPTGHVQRRHLSLVPRSGPTDRAVENEADNGPGRRSADAA